MKWTLICIFALSAWFNSVLVAAEGMEESTFETYEDLGYDNPPCFFDKFSDPVLKLRIGAFFPSSDRFVEIYGHSMPVYQVEGSFEFYDCYRSWINIDYMNKNGRSEHLHYFTNVRLCTISFGVSFFHQISDPLTVYAGIGPVIGYIAVHNRLTHFHRNEQGGAFGLVLKSGLQYDFMRDFFVDLFFDYSYLTPTYRTRVNIGGLKVGGGIGKRF